MSKLLELNNLTFSYRAGNPVLDNISFSADSNETIGIIGANGAGKSSLLKLIAGLLPDYSGEIIVDGTALSKKTLKDIRKKIGFVFQDSDNQLFMNTVFEDVSFAPLNNGFTRDEVLARTDEALAIVHIKHLRDRRIQELSGGEKKLVSIAGILSMSPSIILMDEPGSNLDPRNKRELIKIINNLEGLKVITSHDLDFVEKTCSRVLLINDGKIVADDEAEIIVNNQELLLANNL